MPKNFKKQSKAQMVRGWVKMNPSVKSSRVKMNPSVKVHVKLDSGSVKSGRYVVHVPGTPSASGTTKLREPRSGILHGEDPTLAKRVEEELHTFGR